MLFVLLLAQLVSPSTVVVYLASVRSIHIHLGFPDLTIQAIRLRRVMHGIRRTSATRHLARLSITAEAMDAILMSLELSPLSFDSTMFWAACCLAFFGFLRVSEFTSVPPFTSPSQYYLAIRGSTPASMFISSDGSPLPPSPPLPRRQPLSSDLALSRETDWKFLVTQLQDWCRLGGCCCVFSGPSNSSFGPVVQ